MNSLLKGANHGPCTQNMVKNVSSCLILNRPLIVELHAQYSMPTTNILANSSKQLLFPKNRCATAFIDGYKPRWLAMTKTPIWWQHNAVAILSKKEAQRFSCFVLFFPHQRTLQTLLQCWLCCWTSTTCYRKLRNTPTSQYRTNTWQYCIPVHIDGHWY